MYKIQPVPNLKLNTAMAVFNPCCEIDALSRPNNTEKQLLEGYINDNRGGP